MSFLSFYLANFNHWFLQSTFCFSIWYFSYVFFLHDCFTLSWIIIKSYKLTLYKFGTCANSEHHRWKYTHFFFLNLWLKDILSPESTQISLLQPKPTVRPLSSFVNALSETLVVFLLPLVVASFWFLVFLTSIHSPSKSFLMQTPRVLKLFFQFSPASCIITWLSSETIISPIVPQHLLYIVSHFRYFRNRARHCLSPVSLLLSSYHNFSTIPSEKENEATTTNPECLKFKTFHMKHHLFLHIVIIYFLISKTSWILYTF